MTAGRAASPGVQPGPAAVTESNLRLAVAMIPPSDQPVNDQHEATRPRAADPIAELTRVVMSLVDDLDALADRVLYLEAAAHHLADLAGLDLPSLPDPLPGRPRV